MHGAAAPCTPHLKRKQYSMCPPPLPCCFRSQHQIGTAVNWRNSFQTHKHPHLLTITTPCRNLICMICRVQHTPSSKKPIICTTMHTSIIHTEARFCQLTQYPHGRECRTVLGPAHAFCSGLQSEKKDIVAAIKIY